MFKYWKYRKLILDAGMAILKIEVYPMPSFEEMQKIYKAVGMSGTVGENLKNISDDLMDLTWDNDIQSKKCYIYDYFHDDQKNFLME